MIETYRVRWVIDGNTIQALNPWSSLTRIRLAGAIAPPLEEPLGQHCKTVLERYLPKGIYINVHIIGRDNSNQLLGEVYVADDLINEKLIRLGLASVCPIQLHQVSKKQEILEAEKLAEDEQIGIHGSHGYSRIWKHYYIRGTSVAIVNQISQVCRQKGLTTAYQLAMRCGIKRTTAYRLWDNPQAYPTRKTMTKLCDGLGVEPGQILVFVYR